MLMEGTGFLLFPIGEKASDPLVSSAPHVLFTVGRGMNNTSENDSVVCLKRKLRSSLSSSSRPLSVVPKYLRVDLIQPHVLSC